MEICWGEKVEEKMGLVRLKEEKEEDRRLPPETAAMLKADALRSLTPISSAVADKPLIECHVKHSSWKEILLCCWAPTGGFGDLWNGRHGWFGDLWNLWNLFMEFQEKSTYGLREHKQN